MPRTPEQLYDTMSAAIAYLRDHATRQPQAAEVAAAVGMSPSRFEHAFAAWVGITPKRFLAYLTKERARSLLSSRDLMRAAHASGLSGPGRLHDLLVTYEAVSPGEFKRGGIEVAYGVHQSPFGWCVIGTTARGICFLAFSDTDDDTQARADILGRWPGAALVRDPVATKGLVADIFAGAGKPVHLLVKGTNFQVKVWEALMRIPAGTVADYRSVAEAVGAPKAVRAVGTACGRNNISYLIPCHRVLASDGGLGGYRWGVERKEAMLAWEQARMES